MTSVQDAIKDAGKLFRHAIGAALSSVHAGDEKLAARQPGVAAPQSVSVSSSAFSNGGVIPTKYTQLGENLSTPLSWSGIPTGAKELVLIVEDPDAPFPQPFVHWILHGLPPTVRNLPLGVDTSDTLPQSGNARQGINDGKTRGWTGPKPPAGHGVHHYHFQVLAVDRVLSLGAEATLDDLKKAVAGHVLGEGELIGTYQVD